MCEHDVEIARTLGKMDGKLEALEAGQKAVFRKLDALSCADHQLQIATLRSELPNAINAAVRQAVQECVKNYPTPGGLGPAKSGGLIVAFIGTIEAVKYYLKTKI